MIKQLLPRWFIPLVGAIVAVPFVAWATITVTTPPAVTNNKINMSGNATTCTLDAGTPSQCAATVTASALCQCTNVGASAAIAANGCAVSLSSTTLTVTSANGASNVVNILCDR